MAKIKLTPKTRLVKHLSRVTAARTGESHHKQCYSNASVTDIDASERVLVLSLGQISTLTKALKLNHLILEQVEARDSSWQLNLLADLIKQLEEAKEPPKAEGIDIAPAL